MIDETPGLMLLLMMIVVYRREIASDRGSKEIESPTGVM
jgi:hypothetical protein